MVRLKSHETASGIQKAEIAQSRVVDQYTSVKRTKKSGKKIEVLGVPTTLDAGRSKAYLHGIMRR